MSFNTKNESERNESNKIRNENNSNLKLNLEGNKSKSNNNSVYSNNSCNIYVLNRLK